MMKSLLAAYTYLTVGSGICVLCEPSSSTYSAHAAVGFPVMADTTVSRFAIEGMTCGSCAVTARIAIRRSPGVYKAEVSYDEAKAIVWYDSTQTSPEKIVAALKKATGYVARELK